MKHLLAAAIMLLGFSGSSLAQPLHRTTPEAEGISSKAILDFIEAADAQVADMHSFMLVRNGKVVAEGWWSPYGAELRHSMFSLSKSFTSTAIGLAVAEGKLSIDDEVIKFFPELLPAEQSANLKAMRVRDLLTMSTGHHHEDLKISLRDDADPTRKFLAIPVPHKPGTFFAYNTPATYMQSAIVQKVTGQPIIEYLRTRLFEPLGIETPQWEMSKEGVSLGGTGLHIRTEDIAKFGQLYLQRGEWNGKQLILADWIDLATSKQVSNGSNPQSDWDQGYGFQFWRCRHGLYRGDGAFGQYCIVFPKQNAVLAMTSGTRDMGLVMNLVWDKLLPAMKEGAISGDAAAQSALSTKLKSLMIPVQKGNANSPLATSVSEKTFKLAENFRGIDGVRFTAGAHGDAITLTIRGRDYELPLGRGEWKQSKSELGGALDQGVVIAGEQLIAGSGAWTAPDCFAAKICFAETPMILSLQLRFDGDAITVDTEYNVDFGPTTRPAMHGKKL